MQGRGEERDALHVDPAAEDVTCHQDFFHVVGEGRRTGIFHGIFIHADVRPAVLQVEVSDRGPAFFNGCLPGQRKDPVAAPLDCLQVLDCAGDGATIEGDVVSHEVIHGDIKVLPVYAIFPQRTFVRLVDKAETEILDLHSSRVKFDGERLFLFFRFWLPDESSDVASSLVFGQDERSVLDAQPFDVDGTVVPQALEGKCRDDRSCSCDGVQALTLPIGHRLVVQNHNIIEHQGREWLYVNLGEFYPAVQYAAQRLHRFPCHKRLDSRSLQQNPAGEKQRDDRYNDSPEYL